MERRRLRGEAKDRKSVAIGATGVIVVLSVAMSAWLLPGPIADRMVEADMRAAAEAWSDRIVGQLEEGASTFEYKQIDPGDLDILDSIPQTSDFFLVNLMTPDGVIFWSTNPHQIGQTHLHNDHDDALEQMETGYIVDSIQPGDVNESYIEHYEGVTDAAPLVAEINVPVELAGYQVGSIELFTNIQDERQIAVGRVSWLMKGMAGMAGLLFAGFIVLILRDSRRRMHDLSHRTTRERSLMEDQLRLSREVRLLGELNEWLQSSRSLNELFDMVARFMTHLLPQCEGSMYVYSNSRDVLDGSASWNGGAHKAHIHPEECWGLRRGRTYVFGQNDINFVCNHAEPHDDRPYMCFPVLAHGETVGLMHLRAKHGITQEQFSEGRKLAQLCAEQISLAIANVRMRDELQDQSVRDPLTGLYNRRHLTETLRRLLGRHAKTGEHLAVVSVDIDHFKRFNDNHGHDAGDMVLRAVGAVLTQHVDGDEIACRIGGEELMLLLPGADTALARTRAEALREAVQAVSVRYGDKTLPAITISIGVAVSPVHGTLPQDLMRAADDALYLAKARGRNQVIIAGSTPAEEPSNVHKTIDERAFDRRGALELPSVAAE